MSSRRNSSPSHQIHPKSNDGDGVLDLQDKMEDKGRGKKIVEKCGLEKLPTQIIDVKSEDTNCSTDDSVSVNVRGPNGKKLPTRKGACSGP